jgi:hypothetical protein
MIDGFKNNGERRRDVISRMGFIVEVLNDPEWAGDFAFLDEMAGNLFSHIDYLTALYR